MMDVLLSILNGYLMYLEKVSISKFGIFILFSTSPSIDILNISIKNYNDVVERFLCPENPLEVVKELLR